MRLRLEILALSAGLVVSGCGGGGSGSGTNPPPVAPTVTAVTPSAAAASVAVGSPVTATFSQAMNSASITSSTFTLAAQGGGAVQGTVTYSASNSTATFTPAANLAFGTEYTATITTGASSSTGTALAANYTWSFTTAAAPAPTVTALTPSSGATGVAVTSVVTATFSEAMNASTINASTFTLTGPGGAVSGTVSYSGTGNIATFTPNGSLGFSTQYTAAVTTGATAATGTALAANDTWSFTTAAAPPPLPTVTAVAPANGATSVAVSQAVTATFSQPMNSSTLTSSTFSLTGPNGSVSGTVTYNGATSTATYTPAGNLAYGTSYTATITTGAQDTAGGSLAANYVWNFTTAAAPGNPATVDFGSTYQTIRGFGGSTAWLGQLTTQQAAALFNPATGLGLSILRVRIDPEGSASVNNWQTGNWTAELNNALAAQAANPNAIIFASPWTPPPSMKTSSASQPYYSGAQPCSPGAGYCGGYLDPAYYSSYAAYLEDFVTYFANNGLNLYGISMQNEPDYSAQPNQNYESCSWTAAQMDTWIAADASVLTTRLIMPESFDFNKAQSDTALQDPNAASLIAIIGEHLYGVSNPLPNYSTYQSAGKDVWMTEHYLSPSGSQPAIADALAAAVEVHNSLTTGGYNAYVWWWIWDNPSDGINYGLIDSSTTSPAPTYFGYALGQFARFIQPGYVRVSATANPAAGVYVSAYKGNGHYVIVAINAGAGAPALSFTLDHATVASLTPYQTTSGGGLAQQLAVPVSNGQFTYTLPAQSITTLVQ